MDYWPGFWKVPARSIDPWKKTAYCGQRPGEYNERPFADLDLADADVDGDTLLDGEDDQDNDDYDNIVELYETEKDLDGDMAGTSVDLDGDGMSDNPAWCGWGPGIIPSIDRGGSPWAVNAFNPCAPDPGSRSCPTRIPF